MCKLLSTLTIMEQKLLRRVDPHCSCTILNTFIIDHVFFRIIVTFIVTSDVSISCLGFTFNALAVEEVVLPGIMLRHNFIYRQKQKKKKKIANHY